MFSATRRTTWLVALVVLLAWLGVGAGLSSFAGRLGEVATNDQASFLPQSAESTQVVRAQEAFRQDETLPAIIVWTAEEGDADLSEEQAGAATEALRALADDPALAGQPSPALRSDDGLALQAVVPLDPALEEELPETLERVTSAAERVSGTTVRVAGPAASQADLSDAFAGIDGLLLGVALTTVLLILLLVYRSVLLPLVIIIGAVFALALACAVVYFLADRDVLTVDGQVQGILFILVIGAATDYALLLTARFREELATTEDRYAAMRTAWKRSVEPIVASGATVALGLLALLLSDLANNKALGPVGAIGIACAVLSALTFLPAALLLAGRAAFWPAKPGPKAKRGGGQGVWSRIARLVDTRPRQVWAATLVVLLAGAAFAPTLNSKGVPLDEIFVNDAPSVAAQETLGEHFPGGAGNPTVVIADAGALDQVIASAERTDGVAWAEPVTATGGPGGGEPLVVDDRVRVDVTLEDPADSDAAQETVVDLRTELHALPEADALVGGYTAQQYDTQTQAGEDRALIVPVVLAIILVILIGLLRSLVAPLLLVATVGLNFLTTLGVSALVFQGLLGFAGTDSSVPLYGFVFLVALGVDYNIFLMSRVREETELHGTREGMLRGLTSTGGVITSAGVVLAATFAALSVIPLAFLLQIAFIVAFGVLLDTLVVRSLLVPALVRDIGPRVWWPSPLARVRDEDRKDSAAPAGGRPAEDEPAGAAGER
ncbi:MMPL family transporter [Streptomyces sp. DSM 44915]|uniref:MMPL family transporter n=1 Tax=Streptomyces chisholmiae TaxID=3075540 RepID=A0ABU2JMH5_9ACTN|nr:MMPL family transporter [Streptomyces sp. DSM 44915]MDT0265941.1 MMPL family transporter [Streptomyces sp. DSM 44915]